MEENCFSTLTLSCDVGLKLQMFNKSSPETAASSDGIWSCCYRKVISYIRDDIEYYFIIRVLSLMKDGPVFPKGDH